MSSWKRDVASGLVVLVPLLVIAAVVSWLYNQILGLPFLSSIISQDAAGTIPVEVVRVAIVIVVFAMLVLAVGYLMRTTLGRLIEAGIDDVINRVPVIRIVYNASKLAVETALSGTEDLQKPVRLETWPGIRMTAFKTGKQTEDGREVLFMPTAPNITTGFVMEVEPERLEETDERVEEALTRILSAGFAEQKEEGIPIDVEDERGEEKPTPSPDGGDEQAG
ncbi:DUF502 domain-containing protein [Salinirubrum litoreum]|uniref:DUF502 domain-containing protein n=1 Tax=Salinirubrum litoreum TaxID=1126234 RepID=A0ABD5R891_9EURY|nr:DUF502 domain-containing protein [Salinirubrum litoreum]